ncbi:SH3 domain-containing protein [Roseivivax halodurans]|uniref:SH3 domain-containing protein n=1 Tax=Roseivivax halodurans TaxID=93683 RepID=UPI0026A0354F
MNDSVFIQYALAIFFAVLGFFGIQAWAKSGERPVLVPFLASCLLFLSVPVATSLTGVSLDDFLRRTVGDPIVRGLGYEPIYNPPVEPSDSENIPPQTSPDPPRQSRRVTDDGSPSLRPNGTALERWENYGSVSSVTPYTHYISRNINRLNIHEGPGTQYNIVGTRTGGSCIRVIESRGSWSKVVVPTVGGPWAYYAHNGNLTAIRPSQTCG